MKETNGVLEDIGAVIGFTATTRLVAIFGPGKLYVPIEVVSCHQIAQTIGMSAFKRLVENWAGQTLELCNHHDFHHARLVRGVAAMLREGMPAKDIATLVSLSERQVRNLRLEAERIGLLPQVFRATKG